MIEVNLSKNEGVWMIEVLTARLQRLQGTQPTNTKHQRTIKNILYKIEAEDFYFTRFEKLMCRGCIVEHLPNYDSQIIIDAGPESLFSIGNLRDYTAKLDMGKDLLVKFGYRNGVYVQPFDFSYRYRLVVN